MSATLSATSPVEVILDGSTPQPKHGSVVMTQGMTGTAWQRFYSDGLWHSVSGQVRTWSDLLASNPNQGVAVLLSVTEEDD